VDKQVRQAGYSNHQLLVTAVLASFCALLIYCWAILSGSEFSAALIENGILICICVYGSWVLLIEYRRSQLLSPLALFFLTMMAHFGVTGLMYPYTSFFVNPGNAEYIVGALIYLVVFMAIFHASYRFLAPARSLNQPPSPVVSPTYWRADRALVVAIIFLVIGYLARIYVVKLGIYLHTSLSTDEGARRIPFIGVIRNLELWPGYGALILMIMSYQAKLSKAISMRLIWIAAVGANALNVMYWVPTGAKYDIITAILGPFAVHYLYTKKLPSRSVMAAGIVFVVALFPLTHIYRVAQARFVGNTDVASIEGIKSAVSEALAEATSVNQIGANGRALGRLNQIEPVAAAVRIINDGVIPMKWGIDYLNVFTNMVPRFIWPGKPDVFYGNEFGQLAGMLSPSDEYTSISVTLPGEAYLNFHIAGVLVAGVLAAIFSFMYSLYKRLRCYDSWVLLYVAAIPTMLYIGASFALYISSLIQMWIVLIAATSFIGSRASDTSRTLTAKLPARAA
jgi:hypothetical protein